MIKVLVSSLPDDIPANVHYERYEPDEHWGDAKVTGWLRVSHEGLVISTGEHNFYDDSDFYAIVWDTETNAPREIEYATTRGWTYANSATVDATPEILAAYKTWCRKRDQKTQEARDAKEIATPRAGKAVKVIKGRKIPRGTVAKVAWYGEGRIYGGSARQRYATPPMRVGLLINGERVFTDASNVEVTAQGETS